MKRSTLDITLYQLARLSPVMAFPLFGTYPPYSDPEHLSLLVSRLVVLLAVLALWSMCESTFMLWYRSRVLQAQNSRGYACVAALLGLVTLGLLQIFRTRANQGLFLLLLAVLATRGMSRSGWEQGRTKIAFITSFVSGSLLGALSFLIFRESGIGSEHVTLFGALPWQAGCIALALGSGAAAVETTWFSANSLNDATARWQLPGFRLFLFLGPIVVATLGLSGNLPLCYVTVYLCIPLAARLVRNVNDRGFIAAADFPPTVRAYGLFLGIILACRAYEQGWFV